MKKSNQTGGKNHKKFKKNKVNQQDQPKNHLVLASTYQVYAVVKNKLGGSRLSLFCSDNKIRSGIIRGKFYKKVWFNQSDVVLCDLFEGDDKLCYIVHKYTINEARQLKNLGHHQFDEIGDYHVNEEQEECQQIDMFPHSSESFDELSKEEQSETESSTSSEVDIKTL